MAYENIVKVKDLEPVQKQDVSSDDLLLLYENGEEGEEGTTNSISLGVLQEALLEGKTGLGTLVDHTVEDETEYGGNLKISKATIYTDQSIINNALENMNGIKVNVNVTDEQGQEKEELKVIKTIKGVTYNDQDQSITVTGGGSGGITTISDDDEQDIIVDKLIFTGDGVDIVNTSTDQENPVYKIEIPGSSKAEIKDETGSSSTAQFSTLKPGSNVTFSYNNDNGDLTINSFDNEVSEVNKAYKLKPYIVELSGQNYQLKDGENKNPSFENNEVISVYFINGTISNSAITLFKKPFSLIKNESPLNFITNYGLFVYRENEDKTNPAFYLLSSDQYLSKGRLETISRSDNGKTTIKFFGEDQLTVLDSLPDTVVQKEDIYSTTIVEEQEVLSNTLKEEILPSKVVIKDNTNKISKDDLPAGVGTIVTNVGSIEVYNEDPNTLVLSDFQQAEGTSPIITGGTSIFRGTCDTTPQKIQNTEGDYLAIIEDLNFESLSSNSLILLHCNTAWENTGRYFIHFADYSTNSKEGKIYYNNSFQLSKNAISANDNVLLLYSKESESDHRFYILANDDLVGKAITISQDSNIPNIITLQYENKTYNIPIARDQSVTRVFQAGSGIVFDDNINASTNIRTTTIGLDFPQPPSQEEQVDNRANSFLNGEGNWIQPTFNPENLITSDYFKQLLIDYIFPLGSCFYTTLDEYHFDPNGNYSTTIPSNGTQDWTNNGLYQWVLTKIKETDENNQSITTYRWHKENRDYQA